MRLAVAVGGAAIGGTAGGIVGGPGGALMGAQIGFTGGTLLGGILFPAKSDATKPARDDVRISSSALGRAIPVPLVGAVQPGGQYIWVEEKPTYVTKTEQPDKGRGPEIETVESFFSFICGLCEGPVCAVTALWFDDTKVFDISERNPDGEALSQLLLTGSAPGVSLSGGVQAVDVKQYGPIRIYLGTEDQPQDPLLLADDRIGAAFGGATADFVPPMAGLCYIACDRVPGKAVNRHYPQVKAEVLVSCNSAKNGSEYHPVTTDGDANSRSRLYMLSDRQTFINTGEPRYDQLRWNTADKNPTDAQRITPQRVTPPEDSFMSGPMNAGATWDDPDLLAVASKANAGNLGVSTFNLKTGAEVSPWVNSGVGADQPRCCYYYPDTFNPQLFIWIGETQDRIWCHSASWNASGPEHTADRTQPDIPGTGVTTASFKIEHGGFVGPDGLLYILVGETLSHQVIAAFDPYTLEVVRSLEPYTVSPISSDKFYSGTNLTYDPVTDKIILANRTNRLLRRIDRETLTIDAVPDLLYAPGTADDDEFFLAMKHGPQFGLMALQSGAGDAWSLVDVWNWSVVEQELNADSSYGLSGAPRVPHFDPINQGIWAQDFFDVDRLYFMPVGRKSPICGTAKDIADKISDRVGVAAAERLTAAWVPYIMCGYMTGQRVSGRDALAPIMGWINGDYRMNGDKVEFIRLDTPSVKTIPEEDLGAAETIDAKVPQRDITWPYERTLPQRVEATVISRDHDFNPLPVGMDRPLEGFAGRDIEEVEFPIVVDADSNPQPIEVVERILYQRDVKRRAHRSALTWKHIDLLPGDAFDYVRGGVTYSVRIDKAAWGENNKVLLESVREDVTVVTPSGAAGAGAPAIYESPDLGGGALLQLFMLDSPLLRDQDDAVSGIPVYAGVAGDHKGATLLRSDDQGATWKTVGVFSSGQRIDWGVATTLLADGTVGQTDLINSVTLDMHRGILTSATEADLNGNASVNALLLGQPGRWEVVRFQDVVDETGSPAISGDVFTISTLRRGRRCSDPNTGLHKVGDTAILLDANDLIRLDLPQSELGVERLYKAVAFGQDPSLVSPQRFTLEGIAKKPCKVSQLDAVWDGSSNVDISWNRRSRIGGSWPPQTDVPLGEAFERYTVRIYDTSTSPETVKRTFTVDDAQTVQYTTAQQIADWGSLKFSLDIEVVQVSELVGEGYPNRQVFAGGEFDPDFASVVLLTSFEQDPPLDKSPSGHTLTLGSSAVIGTSKKKFGASALDLSSNSANDYAEAADSDDWSLLSLAWTLEAFVNWNTEFSATILSHGWNLANEFGWQLGHSGTDNFLRFRYSTDGIAAADTIQGAFDPTFGVWYYIAATREKGSPNDTIKLFAGTAGAVSLIASKTLPTATSFFNSAGKLRIGSTEGGTTPEFWTDEIRMTKGVARSITQVPTAAFPAA